MSVRAQTKKKYKSKNIRVLEGSGRFAPFLLAPPEGWQGGFAPLTPPRGVWRQEGFTPSPLTYALYKPILHYTQHNIALLHPHTPATSPLTPYPHFFYRVPPPIPPPPRRPPPYLLHRVIKKYWTPAAALPPTPCTELIFFYPNFFIPPTPCRVKKIIINWCKFARKH